MAHMAAVMGWYGPYRTIAAAKQSAMYDGYWDGLYVVFGYKDLPARGRPRMLYVGVGAPLYNRLTSTHHKIGTGKVARITSIWLGVVESHKVPGRREKKIEPLIDTVEWAMIAILAPCQNEKKRSFPARSFAIMNRWYSNEDYSLSLPKPSLNWPDIIECSGPQAPAYLCWLEQQKVRRFERPPRSISKG